MADSMPLVDYMRRWANRKPDCNANQACAFGRWYNANYETEAAGNDQAWSRWLQLGMPGYGTTLSAPSHPDIGRELTPPGSYSRWRVVHVRPPRTGENYITSFERPYVYTAYGSNDEYIEDNFIIERVDE